MRYDLDIADVYEVLVYYHNNPAEMADVERRHHPLFVLTI